MEDMNEYPVNERVPPSRQIRRPSIARHQTRISRRQYQCYPRETVTKPRAISADLINIVYPEFLRPPRHKARISLEGDPGLQKGLGQTLISRDLIRRDNEMLLNAILSL